MERQLDAYCEHLRSERQVSPHTLSAYRRDLDKVLGWCVKQNIGSWAALDIQRLRSLIARLHAQGQSSRSLARLLSAVRGLYHYLNREGLCDHDPANGLAPPKGERRLPKTLDTDRALQLLEGGVEDDFLARRDQAILELFYSSGLRLSELTGLNLDQLDLADGMVQVLGKGSKTRLLPVGKKAREALEQWLPLRAMAKPGGRCGVRQPTGSTSRPPSDPGAGQGCRRARTGAEPASAHAAALLRQPSAGILPGPARGAGTARALGHQDHADLHPPGLPAPGHGLRQRPPKGQTH
ncbi:UNVERIFIED_ORG: integrase [Pseudomonas reinekei]|nr:integrase [Pseudomonas reinekei]